MLCSFVLIITDNLVITRSRVLVSSVISCFIPVYSEAIRKPFQVLVPERFRYIGRSGSRDGGEAGTYVFASV